MKMATIKMGLMIMRMIMMKMTTTILIEPPAVSCTALQLAKSPELIHRDFRHHRHHHCHLDNNRHHYHSVILALSSLSSIIIAV